MLIAWAAVSFVTGQTHGQLMLYLKTYPYPGLSGDFPVSTMGWTIDIPTQPNRLYQDSGGVEPFLPMRLPPPQWHSTLPRLFSPRAERLSQASIYVQLAKGEAVSGRLKSELAIHLIWHWVDRRVEAHVMVTFLGYCLWVCLQQKLKAAAPGLSPWQVRDRFKRIVQAEVWFKLKAGGAIWSATDPPNPNLSRRCQGTSGTGLCPTSRRHESARIRLPRYDRAKDGHTRISLEKQFSSANSVKVEPGFTPPISGGAFGAKRNDNAHHVRM